MPTILITGGSRGLGLALARELAQHGWTLILDARGAEALEAARAELARYTTVIALSGDVNNAQHRADLIQAVQAAGGLDALINNAGTLSVTPRPDLLDYPLTRLADVFQTNVIAPLALIQDARSVLKPGARIVNITSDAAVEPYAGWGGYGSSKAALEQLTGILAAENPDWRVYSVDPGDMRTQMHQDAFPDEDISDRPLPDESVPGLMRLLNEPFPSGRYRAKALDPQAEQRTVSGLRVMLKVADFDKAVALYRDALHLPVHDLWIEPDSKGILLDAGLATLELLDAMQTAEVDQIEVGHTTTGHIRLALTVDEVDSAAQSISSAGAIAISNVVLTPWHHRNQRFEVPDVHPGIPLTLSQVVDEAQNEADNEAEHERA